MKSLQVICLLLVNQVLATQIIPKHPHTPGLGYKCGFMFPSTQHIYHNAVLFKISFSCTASPETGKSVDDKATYVAKVVSCVNSILASKLYKCTLF